MVAEAVVPEIADLFIAIEDDYPKTALGAGILTERDEELELPVLVGNSSQRFLLSSVIAYLEMLKEANAEAITPCIYRVSINSETIYSGLRFWIKKWKGNGWITAKGTPVQNKELWLQLEALVNEIAVGMTVVRLDDMVITTESLALAHKLKHAVHEQLHGASVAKPTTIPMSTPTVDNVAPEYLPGQGMW